MLMCCSVEDDVRQMCLEDLIDPAAVAHTADQTHDLCICLQCSITLCNIDFLLQFIHRIFIDVDQHQLLRIIMQDLSYHILSCPPVQEIAEMRMDTFTLEDNIFLPLVLAGMPYAGMAERLKPLAARLGMNFAFGTSIAGCACSLLFNIFNRAGIGSAQKALDSFYEAFTEFVMQRPLSDNVQAICQQEDQAAFLRHAVGELGNRMTEGVSQAVSRSMAPITQSVSQYIAAETQAQIEGLNHIVNSFVTRMNGALDGQFTRLGQTLSAINQQQCVDRDALNGAMDAAMNILGGMQEMSAVMQNISARFESYAGELALSQQDQQAFADQTNALLASMHAAAQEQMDYINALRAGQESMQANMQQYADWSGRVLTAVQQQSQDTNAAAQQAGEAMRESSRQLSESYTSFVAGISDGLNRSMGLFEKNMQGMLSLLDGKLADIEKTAKAAQNGYALKNEQLGEATDGLLQSLSRLQRALADMTQCVAAAADGLREPASPAEGA